ncbi:hypothetical protein MMC07_004170 [Pseudocyphellaria aurata]|nr:hypothetical protein [Pseudocyphellaria aurata]
MQSLSSFALGLGVILTPAFIASGSRLPIANEPKTKSLESRQAPGVVATSDFLRRAGHASVVAGDWVYIDGGEFSVMSDGKPDYQYSTTILSIDLSQTWSNSTVTIHSTYKPTGVPNLTHSSLWYDEREDLLYSGFAGRAPTFGDRPWPSNSSLWSFKPDGAGSGSWDKVIDSDSLVWHSFTRPCQPMMAFGSGSAYVLGGFESWQTRSPWDDSFYNTALPGLVQFNLTTRTFSNSTAGGYSFYGTAERGAMHYVSSFGPDGLFVVMGGDDAWHPQPDGSSLIELETISIYDPSSRQWFNQTTTGNIPQRRKEFCLAGIASNNGTYEIFMYAGWGGDLGKSAIPFDEIYILTLPAFHWLKVDYPPQQPRHALTCHAVGGSQILTIGGLDSNSNHTMDAEIYHSTFDTSPDPFAQGLAIFNMTALKFANQYTAKASPYVQSDMVRRYHATRPATKFDSPGLAKLLDITHFSNTTNPSVTKSDVLPSSTGFPDSSNPSKRTPIGAIAGGVVGGVAVLALVGALILFARKRRRLRESEPPSHLEVSGESKRQQPRGPQEMYQMPGEMGGNPVAELGARSPVELRGEYNAAELRGEYDAVELNRSARR